MQIILAVYYAVLTIILTMFCHILSRILFLFEGYPLVCMFVQLTSLSEICISVCFSFLHPLNVLIINVHIYAILSYLFFLSTFLSPSFFLLSLEFLRSSFFDIIII